MMEETSHCSAQQASGSPSNTVIVKEMESIVNATTKKSAPVWKTVHKKHQTSMIVKLRTMMKSGVPRGAVEQKAYLAGIDPSLVMGPSKKRSTVSMKRRYEETRAAQHAANLAKLVKMAKMGVPLAAVG